MVKFIVTYDEAVHEETRYYIFSLLDIKEFANAIRCHWASRIHCIGVWMLLFRKIIPECAKIIPLRTSLLFGILCSISSKICRIKCPLPEESVDDDYLAKVLFSIHT